MVLLNCGGVIDLFGLLQARLDTQESTGGGQRSVEDVPHPDCRWYVLDSHRPCHLANAAGHGVKLQCIADGEENGLLEELMAHQHILEDTEFEDFEVDEDEPPTQRRSHPTCSRLGAAPT